MIAFTASQDLVLGAIASHSEGEKIMIKPVLKGIAVVLIMTIGTLLVFYLNRSDPWGRIPGKRLPGEEMTESIEDWSFTQQARGVTLEVRPSAPYSIDASFLFPV